MRKESTADKLIEATDRLEDALNVGREAFDVINDIKIDVENLEDSADQNEDYVEQMIELMKDHFPHMPESTTPHEIREVISKAIHRNAGNPLNYRKGFSDALRLINKHFTEVTNG